MYFSSLNIFLFIYFEYLTCVGIFKATGYLSEYGEDVRYICISSFCLYGSPLGIGTANGAEACICAVHRLYRPRRRPCSNIGKQSDFPQCRQLIPLSSDVLYFPIVRCMATGL